MQNISSTFFVMFLSLIACQDRRENNAKAPLKDLINGVWYYQERNGEYAEFVLLKNVDWGYDRRTGIVQRDIRIVGDTIINRYYNGTDHLFGYWKIVEATPDSILVVSSFGGYKLNFRRLNLDIDIGRLVAFDTLAIDSYIDGYRSRKMAWEAKSPK